MSILLDTHVWVWWLLDSAVLPRDERAAISVLAAAGGVCVAAISLWEVQMLHAKGRLPLTRPFDRWIREATAPGAVQLLPLDAEVVVALDDLPKAFHGDPADRLIVATARAHGLPLATHDSGIRKSRAAKLWKP